MSVKESWTVPVKEESSDSQRLINRSGFDSRTGIYSSLLQLSDHLKVPTDPELGIASFVLSQFPDPYVAESKIALIDSATNQQLTYAQLHRSIRSLACALYHLGVRKGDVVFLLSPNSLLYPTICLAIFSVGAILSPANPINTPSEIAKQVLDSGAKLAISAPQEFYKLVQTGVPTIVTFHHQSNGCDSLSIEELIESSDPRELPEIKVKQTDTAAILYSSGTTGVSKGVILTHSNFIATVRLVRWYAEGTSSQDDIFLGFIPIFHIYGLGFFALGLFCAGITTVLMQRFDLQAMVNAIQTHKVNNIPAVPPVVLGLVKYCKGNSSLSTLRRVGSGAAPLSKELIEAFRRQFPWVELRQGYGLTESCGTGSGFLSDEDARAHPRSCGLLLPTFCAKVVDIETGLALSPNKEGEVWLKSPTIMKGYLGNEEATAATIDKDGWLKTGDLGYFDEDGFLYIVDRIKELIKHNGYQVAPAELEAVLLGHSNILDAAVIPVEDEESGQIPMAYVVKAAGSELTEEEVIHFVAGQVAPYKKVRRVGFINVIPKSAAGKILRKQLILQSQQQILSKL
ncbi:4-coumarate--CoA ligase-like 5 [Durio zibethinus]|uniref:4-coumarate--CoA ligase-like 5 n=1 Tax=Durio zibethinus TaxID=66656 RepID=A0A6P5YWE5_DURZI|nr:4-coumarate--CoA ligase-like 5 [Durio zibethinus]